MNPYALRADLSRLLHDLHDGTKDLGTAFAAIGKLIERGIDLSIITADINASILLRQGERRAAASRQKDLMELHAFAQGVDFAKKQRGAS